jgi:hypothetical protein
MMRLYAETERMRPEGNRIKPQGARMKPQRARMKPQRTRMEGQVYRWGGAGRGLGPGARKIAAKLGGVGCAWVLLYGVGERLPERRQRLTGFMKAGRWGRWKGERQGIMDIRGDGAAGISADHSSNPLKFMKLLIVARYPPR